MTQFRYEKYGASKHSGYAIFEGNTLICICKYKKGALALIARLNAFIDDINRIKKERM